MGGLRTLRGATGKVIGPCYPRHCAEELEAAISAFLDVHNEDERALKWIKSADDILGAIERYYARIVQNTSQ